MHGRSQDTTRSLESSNFTVAYSALFKLCDWTAFYLRDNPFKDYYCVHVRVHPIGYDTLHNDISRRQYILTISSYPSVHKS